MDRDREVHLQYETYPYPLRDPMEEHHRLVTGSPSHLDELNHYVFAGGRPFAAPFRVLVAGGGSGDATIMLAQQLSDRGTAAEIVHLDLSRAALSLAAERAAVRNLDRIRFVQGSLLDGTALGLGTFDYIDCCGVLHHLADPAAGLAALVAMLRPDGGLGLMLYAPLGRTGVYPVQAALRRLVGGRPLGERAAAARALLSDLPKDHWFQRNPYVTDHRLDDDAALFDLLLHSRDHPFSVSELFALCDSAGLAVTEFIEPALYDPAFYLRDSALRAAAAALPWPERCGLAENLSGAMKTHTFYAVPAARRNRATADLADGTLCPLVHGQDRATLAGALRSGGRLKLKVGGRSVTIGLPPEAADLVERADGRSSIDDLASRLGLTGAAFRAHFMPTYRTLNGFNLMLLRGSPP